jgi:hypothetical protein
VSEDVRPATVIASASTTMAETKFIRPVNSGTYIASSEDRLSHVLEPFSFLGVDLNQDAQDLNDLNQNIATVHLWSVAGGLAQRR